MTSLDLSNNALGRDSSGELLTDWCPSETSAGLKPGSGWCPEGTPIEDTAGSMVYLDLSGNDFTGEQELWNIRANAPGNSLQTSSAAPGFMLSEHAEFPQAACAGQLKAHGMMLHH